MGVRESIRALGILFLLLAMAACGALGYHEVKKGETLYSISWRYGEDYKKLAQWNDIEPPYIIHEGERLRLTPPGPSPVRQGAEKRAGKQDKPALRPQTDKPSRAAAPEAAPKPATTARQASQPRPEQVIPNRRLTWTWPVNGKVIKTFSAKGAGRKGIDIAAKAGTPVKAAAYGRVVYSGAGLQHYGKLIIIKHNARYLSAYAHNRKLLVGEGVVVQKGQQIAEMGRSGTGVDRVMLHFEIRADGVPVDPLAFLPARKI